MIAVVEGSIVGDGAIDFATRIVVFVVSVVVAILVDVVLGDNAVVEFDVHGYRHSSCRWCWYCY